MQRSLRCLLQTYVAVCCKQCVAQPYRGEGFNTKGLMAEAEVVQERQAIQKEETADLSDEEFMQREWDKKVDAVISASK